MVEFAGISDELAEADRGFVPDADAPVLATPTIIAVTTLTTPTVL